MNDVALAGEILPDLLSIPTAELRGELARALELTAGHLQRMAAIWRELERRGEDLSDLRRGMGTYLPMIAAGHLAAEAVVRFAGNHIALRGMAQLPIEEQRRIAHSGMIPVALEKDGEIVETQMQADRLTNRLASQVFDGPRIRPAREQKDMMAPGAGVKSPYPQPLSVRKGHMKIGQKWVPNSQVIASIMASEEGAAPDIDEDDIKAVGMTLSLTKAEHRALKVSAARAGVSITHLVRATLWSAGLLSSQ